MLWQDVCEVFSRTDIESSSSNDNSELLFHSIQLFLVNYDNASYLLLY